MPETIKSSVLQARVAPVKMPTTLALEHFDFYYAPVYAGLWPSMRLALLSPHKYLAVVNVFSSRKNDHCQHLRSLGAVDLVDLLNDHGQCEQNVEAKDGQIVATDHLSDQLTTADEGQRRKHVQMELTALNDIRMRGQGGMGEFMPASETFQLDQLGRDQLNKPTPVRFTGFEGANLKIPHIVDDFQCPPNLQLMLFPRANIDEFPPRVHGSAGEPGWYLMIGSSIMPILALSLEQGDFFLDVCAAPGGKSILAMQTQLPSKIVCNDPKLSRLGQLRRTMLAFLPHQDSDWAEKIVLKKKDATDLVHWDESQCYDKVLADVPCSSDRLSLKRETDNLFSRNLSKERLQLPFKQTMILIHSKSDFSNALRSVRIGGMVVYSTCTLSPVQNETVVENALAIAAEKFGIRVRERKLDKLVNRLRSTGLFQFSARLSLGCLIVPFLPSNFGPMYVCKLERLK